MYKIPTYYTSYRHTATNYHTPKLNSFVKYFHENNLPKSEFPYMKL